MKSTFPILLINIIIYINDKQKNYYLRYIFCNHNKE